MKEIYIFLELEINSTDISEQRAMEPENWESLENDFTNAFKRDKIFSAIFYLQDVPNNLDNHIYNIDNGVNFFLKKQDSENALILSEDISPSVNNYNSLSNVLIHENSKSLNNEGVYTHHKDKKKLIKNGYKKVKEKNLILFKTEM